MLGQTYRYISALRMTVLTLTKGYGISTYNFAMTDKYTNKNSRAPRVPHIRLCSETEISLCDHLDYHSSDHIHNSFLKVVHI